MSWQAWQAVASAERVLASTDDAPVVRAVRAAGHDVELWADPSPAALLAAGAETATGHVVWLATDEESTRLAGGLAAEVVELTDAGTRPDGSQDGPAAAAEAPPRVEVLHASYDVPGSRLLDLVTVMDRLRRECPWDREQTHRSLAKYLLEECYETIEAIETGDLVHLREELGDLLLQVYFHARIAAEGEERADSSGEDDDGEVAFTIDDVAAGIVEKLVRRHPHVFSVAEETSDPVSRADVEASWEVLKAAEKGRGSVLEGIPWALPALGLADKVVGRAARAGVHVEATDSPAAAAGASGAPEQDRLGDELLRLVAQARGHGVDPEQSLRDAVRRLADRVRAAENP